MGGGAQYLLTLEQTNSGVNHNGDWRSGTSTDLRNVLQYLSEQVSVILHKLAAVLSEMFASCVTSWVLCQYSSAADFIGECSAGGSRDYL